MEASTIQLQIQFQCPLCLHRWVPLPSDIAVGSRSSISDPAATSALSPILVPKLACCRRCCYRQFQLWTAPSNCRLLRPFSWPVCQDLAGLGQSFCPFSIVFRFMLHYSSCIGVFVGLLHPFPCFSLDLFRLLPLYCLERDQRKKKSNVSVLLRVLNELCLLIFIIVLQIMAMVQRGERPPNIKVNYL